MGQKQSTEKDRRKSEKRPAAPDRPQEPAPARAPARAPTVASTTLRPQVQPCRWPSSSGSILAFSCDRCPGRQSRGAVRGHPGRQSLGAACPSASCCAAFRRTAVDQTRLALSRRSSASSACMCADQQWHKPRCTRMGGARGRRGEVPAQQLGPPTLLMTAALASLCLSLSPNLHALPNHWRCWAAWALHRACDCMMLVLRRLIRLMDCSTHR